MKVGYVFSGTSLSAGSTKSLLLILEYMKSQGHTCYVICPDSNGAYRYLTKRGFRCLNVPYRFASLPKHESIKDLLYFIPKYFARKILNYRAVVKCVNLLKNEDIQLIHSNTSVTNIGNRIAEKLKCVHITHIREYGDLDFNQIMPGINRRLNRHGNYNICITRGIYSHRRLNDNNSIVIYNGIESKDYVRFNPNKEPFILYAGRIEKTKGIETLIDAYIKVVQEKTSYKLKLLIAGGAASPPQLELYEELKKRLSKYPEVENRVEWLGDIDNISDYYYNAYVTVVPSYFEGFGRVMAEASFNGSLVLGRNTGGTKEQFDNGFAYTGDEIGLRFDTEDELIKQLKIIENFDSTNFFDMIKRSQSAVVQFYSKESYVESVFKFYNEILNIK